MSTTLLPVTQWRGGSTSSIGRPACASIAHPARAGKPAGCRVGAGASRVRAAQRPQGWGGRWRGRRWQWSSSGGQPGSLARRHRGPGRCSGHKGCGGAVVAAGGGRSQASRQAAWEAMRQQAARQEAPRSRGRTPSPVDEGLQPVLFTLWGLGGVAVPTDSPLPARPATRDSTSITAETRTDGLFGQDRGREAPPYRNWAHCQVH